MRSVAYALMLALLVLSAPLRGYAEEPPEGAAPGELAKEGVERLLHALDALIQMIPQYEMPQLNENGDIIIKRKREDDSAPESETEDDQTST